MTDPQITTCLIAATVWLNGTDEEKSAMLKSLAAHEARGLNKPWDHRAEERMAHIANGGTVGNLPTDPAVRGGRRPDRREGDFVCTDGESWHYEPYSGGAA